MPDRKRRRSKASPIPQGKTQETCQTARIPFVTSRRFNLQSFTNIARHAHASNVGVTAKEHAGRLLLKVVDDGRGIMKANINDSRSFRLLGMRIGPPSSMGNSKSIALRGRALRSR